MPDAFREVIRMIYAGTMIYSGHYDKAKATEALRKGWVDMIGFGRPFIANPDLPRRLQQDLTLNSADASKYFGGGGAGYTDYPTARDQG